MLDQLCPPALLYVAFSLTQIIIDIFKNMYNTAFLKFIVMIIFTIVLNTLCINGMGVISWFIVFIPFIMMTVITTLLLVFFGLSPTTGGLDYNINYQHAKPKKADIVTKKKSSSIDNTIDDTIDNTSDYISDTIDKYIYPHAKPKKDDVATKKKVSSIDQYI